MSSPGSAADAGSGPLTPDRRRELTRRHLREAAAAVFAERGYEKASLDEIARRAGFTKGAIYSNFDSKEELFLELSHGREVQMVEAFFAASGPAGHGEPATTEITRVFERLAPTPQEWFLYEEFMLYARRDPALLERLRAESERTFEFLVEMVERQWRGANDSEPPLPFRDLARLYVSLFDGLTRQRAFQPEAVPDDLFGRLLDFINSSLETREP